MPQGPGTYGKKKGRPKNKKKPNQFKGFSGITGKQVQSTVTKKKKKKVALTEGGKTIAIKPSGKTYSGPSSLRNAGKGPKPKNTLAKKYGRKDKKDKFASGTGIGKGGMPLKKNTTVKKKKQTRKKYMGI